MITNHSKALHKVNFLRLRDFCLCDIVDLTQLHKMHLLRLSLTANMLVTNPPSQISVTLVALKMKYLSRNVTITLPCHHAHKQWLHAQPNFCFVCISFSLPYLLL